MDKILNKTMLEYFYKKLQNIFLRRDELSTFILSKDGIEEVLAGTDVDISLFATDIAGIKADAISMKNSFQSNIDTVALSLDTISKTITALTQDIDALDNKYSAAQSLIDGINGSIVNSGVYYDYADAKYTAISDAISALDAKFETKVTSISSDLGTATASITGSIFEDPTSATKQLKSDITISADQINLTANDKITLAINNAVADKTDEDDVVGLIIDNVLNNSQVKIKANNIILDGQTEFTDEILGKDATFSGTLNAATGTFAGDISAATGTFSGALNGATGTFSGDISAANGTFSGKINAADGSTFRGTVYATSLVLGDDDAISSFSSVKGSTSVTSSDGLLTLVSGSNTYTAYDAAHSQYSIASGGLTVGTTPENISSAVDNATGLSISTNGLLKANNAVISGKVYANGGEFTGDVTAKSLKLSDTCVVGSNLTLDSTGKVTAKNAEITGAITATSLTLGGTSYTSWDSVKVDAASVDTSTIQSSIESKLDGKYIPIATAIGTGTVDATTNTVDNGQPKFTVSSEGLLTALNAVIYGTIYATSGYFTGKITSTEGTIGKWNIGDGKLYSTSGDYICELISSLDGSYNTEFNIQKYGVGKVLRICGNNISIGNTVDGLENGQTINLNGSDGEIESKKVIVTGSDYSSITNLNVTNLKVNNTPISTVIANSSSSATLSITEVDELPTPSASIANKLFVNKAPAVTGVDSTGLFTCLKLKEEQFTFNNDVFSAFIYNNDNITYDRNNKPVGGSWVGNIKNINSESDYFYRNDYSGTTYSWFFIKDPSDESKVYPLYVDDNDTLYYGQILDNYGNIKPLSVSELTSDTSSSTYASYISYSVTITGGYKLYKIGLTEID